MGNISASGKIKLIDVNFPKSYLEHIQGPKFGIKGLRDALGIHDRPLLNAMIKPNIGWTPAQGAELFYEASRGGIDIIKDDELMPADQPHCPLKERVTRMMAMEKKVFEESGEHTLYAVNITDEVHRLKDNALRALEYGANCLMINYYTCGFSAAKASAEDKDIKVPILAHVDFAGVFVASPFHGLAGNLMIGKLARMAGADFQIQGNPYGKFPVPLFNCLQIAHYSTQPLYHIKPMMPAISGGTTQTVVQKLISLLGMDIILAAGGAVHGHPGGSRAGAMAMRQAVDAALKEIHVADYAKDHKELAQAINIWGDTSKIFDLMQ
jgi:2,3-diketo-5-methylthiopentyl-1-phosphate enolase